ncbi:MAG: aminodeoxychorismate/anthranilate synthase component II [Acidobacteria bacterium]|nr:aminodeoxychorismate/anthranilate synthase component II [Acidobacteriota bacterium]MBI3487859.1 aminodeoxychorismate/anthranilate synthase component II [Acidobacteriota bacterium]
MILLIDALDSFTYNLVQAFETLGAETKVVRHDAITLAQAQALNPRAVVLSPGPGHPTENLAHMALGASDWAVPLLGVCLGHQALAAASGGRVTRAVEPLHGEATPLEHEGAGLFQGLPAGLPVGRYHSLIVDPASLPGCWRVTGRSPGGEIMAMEHCQLPRWGVQFHPESILTPDGPAMLANFLRLALERHP